MINHIITNKLIHPIYLDMIRRPNDRIILDDFMYILYTMYACQHLKGIITYKHHPHMVYFYYAETTTET